jgi:hypothetical protein
MDGQMTGNTSFDKIVPATKNSNNLKTDLLKKYMNMRSRSPYSRNKDLHQSMDRSSISKYDSNAKKDTLKTDKSQLNFSSVGERREKSRNMILESTMERKNLKDSIMKRYKESNTRADSRSKDQDSMKKSSLYQTFLDKKEKVSATKKIKSDSRNWASTDSAF